MNRDVCEHFSPSDLPCDQCNPETRQTLEIDMSETLRLADALGIVSVGGPLTVTMHEAAAELRRLHAELKRKSDAIQRLWKERDELRSECRVLVRQNGEWQELTAELVEALRCADAMLSGANMDAKAVERKVSAALAKVQGEMK